MLALTDVISSLGPLLDGIVAQGGGRVQSFAFIPWGRHQDQARWSALPEAGIGSPATTTRGSALSLRQVANPHVVTDMGGGAQQNRQSIDIQAWWADDVDLTDPDAYREAVVAAIKARVRANEKTVPGAIFVAVTNVINGDFLVAASGTGNHTHLVIVTVEAWCDDVYG